MLDALYAAFFQSLSGPADEAPVTPPAEQTSAVPLETPAPAPAAPVRHCRNMTPTGSHIPVRVCATDEEERRLAEDTRDDILHRPHLALSPEQIQSQLANKH
ncbi:MAG TPA: hypothetical protein VG841_09425 [Caulobacterales bacterium]|nr:hypothetical protein [Caulobacterales bacterium]